MAIEIPFAESSKTFIDKINKALTENNGKLSGDENQGEIEINSPVGAIKATYKINDKKAVVEIIKKPFFLTEELIKNEMLKFLR